MQTVRVRIWAENAGVVVSQWAADSVGIWLEKGGVTTQRNVNTVRDHVCEIAQLMGISNNQGAGPE